MGRPNTRGCPAKRPVAKRRGHEATHQNLGNIFTSPMSAYLTSTGTTLQFQDGLEELRAEYVMQRYRDVWVVTPTTPFLAIDEGVLREKMAGIDSFVALSSAFLFQNIEPREMGVRLAASLAGPGIIASGSSSAEVLVEGEANPQSNCIWRGNQLLQVGTFPFGALSTHYIAVEPGRIFRRQIGQLEAVRGNTQSEARSADFDFERLGELIHVFHVERLGHGSKGDLARYSSLLDGIFEQNIAALHFVADHHARAPKPGPKYDYKAGKLSRYGRLTHNEAGEPMIETSFTLMHYEKALHEFDSLKRATATQDVERTYVHGVYCVIAISACIEAIANRLLFDASGIHPSSQSGTAIGRINFAARKLAQQRKESFNSLGERHPDGSAMERVRVLRNTFIHANEEGAPIDPAVLVSSQMTEISETACRGFLRSLRLTVAFVFDQLTWMNRPIVTATNVKWLGEIEVP